MTFWVKTIQNSARKGDGQNDGQEQEMVWQGRGGEANQSQGGWRRINQGPEESVKERKTRCSLLQMSS